MLMTTPNTTTNILETIATEIHKILKVENKKIGEITREAELNAHVGLTSLNLAELVVALEIRLSVDPFSALVPITEVRTIGDLCQAYERALSGENATPEFSTNDALLQAQRRAADRRQR